MCTYLVGSTEYLLPELLGCKREEVITWSNETKLPPSTEKPLFLHFLDYPYEGEGLPKPKKLIFFRRGIITAGRLEGLGPLITPLNFSQVSYASIGVSEGFYVEATTFVPQTSVITSEEEYLRLLRRVLSEGEERNDRTGVGTISVFGAHLVFDLTKGFPLITTKEVPFRHVAVELEWMLRGITTVKYLQEKKVHIWDADSKRAHLRELKYPEGELGPVYGFQWRNFGGKHDPSQPRHISSGLPEASRGKDQIQEALRLIRHDPTSRRNYVSAWAPGELNKMALPPCHLSFQFYVRQGKFLDCKADLRSNDLFIGAPFNISSYALLTCLFSAMTNLTPGRLVYSVGDAHVYKNHLEQVNLLLSRPTRALPSLSFKKVPEKPEDFLYEMVVLEGYNPHPKIKAKMAV